MTSAYAWFGFGVCVALVVWMLLRAGKRSERAKSVEAAKRVAAGKATQPRNISAVRERLRQRGKL